MSKKELMPLENVNAVKIFSEDGLDELIEKIETEARSHVPDLTTDKGRKAIASMSAKVASSKTLLDGLGKDLVSGIKEKAKVIDGGRKKMRDRLDELKLEVRKPLTDWEDAEKERVADIIKKINSVEANGVLVSENWLELSAATMKERLSDLTKAIYFDYGEYEPRALMVLDAAVVRILDAIGRRDKHDAEQVELDNLREEKAEREENERIAREASEKKEREANEKKEREKREAQIAADATKAAEQKAADDKKAAAKKAADARKKVVADKNAAVKREAEAKAGAEKLANEAAARERQKIAAEKKADDEAAVKREANKAHHKKINNQSVADLVTSGIDKKIAIEVVTVIAQKKIANITIQY